jgi:hypothetical protein
MDFRENVEWIFNAHKKANKVILSCDNLTQLDVAIKYADNLKIRFGSIKCRSALEKNALKSIIEDVNGLIKLKRKSLRQSPKNCS